MRACLCELAIVQGLKTLRINKVILFGHDLINQPEQDSILNYLIAGGDISVYGLTNAITRASQDVEAYDQATALKSIGWQVATMPEAQWKEINA